MAAMLMAAWNEGGAAIKTRSGFSVASAVA